jgi:dynein heavy chain 2
MNQEDLDINSIYNSWITKNLKENKEVVKSWFDNYFIEVFKNYKENYPIMLNTTNYGSINNFLSIFNFLFKNKNFNANSLAKSAFADAIIKGLGNNLDIEQRKKFAMQVFSITGEKPSNLNNILDVYYDPIKQTTINFEFNPDENVISDTKQFSTGYPIIKTSSTKANLYILKMWLENNEPFIVVGPEGAGKSLLISYATSQLRSCQITTLNCTSQTS